MTTAQMLITLGVATLLASASIIAWFIVNARLRRGHYARCHVCKHAAYAHGNAGCTARVELPHGAARCACAIPYGIKR